MSTIFFTNEPPMIHCIANEYPAMKDSEAFMEVQLLFKDQGKLGCNHLVWNDYYAPEQYSQKYPALAQYIVTHNLIVENRDLVLYNNIEIE